MFTHETSWSPRARWLLTAFNALIVLSLLAPALLIQGEERFLLLAVAALTAVLTFGIIQVFSTVRVTVDDQALTVGFGPFRERVPLERITACRPTTYQWGDWGGWGIRLGWRAKLYNVPGDGGVAVELTLEDGRRLLFSSHAPEAVCQALRERRPEVWQV